MACSLPFSSMVPRCCPIGPCRRKYDLSRAGVGSVPGRPVGCRGDPAGLPSFAGIAGWLAAAVPAALSYGSCPRSSDAPGSRNCRCKTPTRSPASGKSTAVTPLLWPSHPSRAWTTALWLCPLNGAAMKKTPIVSAIGVSLSNFGPALPEPRQTVATKRTSSLASGTHLRNRRFQCGPMLSRSSSRQHALRYELRIGNGCRNRRD